MPDTWNHVAVGLAERDGEPMLRVVRRVAGHPYVRIVDPTERELLRAVRDLLAISESDVTAPPKPRLGGSDDPLADALHSRLSDIPQTPYDLKNSKLGGKGRVSYDDNSIVRAPRDDFEEEHREQHARDHRTEM